MWRMLQQDKPDDYILATGEQHTVREFVELSFLEIGVRIFWKGIGIEEEGIDESTGQVLVKIDPRYFRPTETDLLLGDPAKARKVLEWQHTTSFTQLVHEMVENDLVLMKARISDHHRSV